MWPQVRLRSLFPSSVGVAEREQQEALAREKARLQEMDEEEYDALTEDQRVRFDSELLQAVRDRKQRSGCSSSEGLCVCVWGGGWPAWPLALANHVLSCGVVSMQPQSWKEGSDVLRVFCPFLRPP